MANPVQSAYGPLYDAGKVVLAELGARVLALEAEGLGTERVEEQLLDLHLGLEAAAREPDEQRRTAILAYLQETYRLLAVGADPLLRARLPEIPTVGATVRPYFLMVNGVPLLAGGLLLFNGARLVPNDV